MMGGIWIGKKRKGGGIILVVSGIMKLFCIKFVGGIVWIMGGMMVLVRKGKEGIDEGA